MTKGCMKFQNKVSCLNVSGFIKLIEGKCGKSNFHKCHKKGWVILFLGEPSTLISKPHKQDKKTSLTNTNKLEWFMEQVITNNKESTFQVTLSLLKSMDAHMAT
jgi:hypothetical protein